MLIYHFTCLVNLPEVIREGITKGEIPTAKTPYGDRPQAANLTTNPKREDQDLWNTGRVDKTRIRLTMDLPDSDLTSFREVKERFKITSTWLKRLAPYHARQHWYFAFGGVRPDHITLVEKWDDGKYSAVENLPELVQQVENERERAMVLRISTSGIGRGALVMELKPGGENSWLLDGRDAG